MYYKMPKDPHVKITAYIGGRRFMKYTDAQVKKVIQEFVNETGQHEIRYVISFCLGYFGYITNQIWRCITEVIDKDGEQE